MASWLPPRLTPGRCTEQRLPILAVHGALPATARRGSQDGQSGFWTRNVAALCPCRCPHEAALGSRRRLATVSFHDIRGNAASRGNRQYQALGGSSHERLGSRCMRWRRVVWELASARVSLWCMGFWPVCGSGVPSPRRAAKQASSNADAERCTLMHADGTGALASARLPGGGCAMSAVKHRAGPRPIRVHQRASFCICVETCLLCRVPRCHCRRPGEAWPGIGAWQRVFWCIGCFRRGRCCRAVPGDGRIGA
jgi:hypothetical protein